MATAAPSPKPRTVAQNRAIWGLVNQISAASGLDRDELAPMLQEACRAESGQEHTSRLTVDQALRVIRRLERELATYAKPAATKPQPAPHEPWGPRRKGPRDQLPMTAFQGVVINGLFAVCGYTDLKRRAGFCQRQVKASWPRTQAEADAVITPLSEMALRHVDARDVQRQVLVMQGDPRLDTWKRDFLDDLVERYGRTTDPASVLTPHRLLKILECEAWLSERSPR